MSNLPLTFLITAIVLLVVLVGYTIYFNRVIYPHCRIAILLALEKAYHKCTLKQMYQYDSATCELPKSHRVARICIGRMIAEGLVEQHQSFEPAHTSSKSSQRLLSMTKQGRALLKHQRSTHT